MPDFELPSELRTNAWTGTESPVSPVDPASATWGLRDRFVGGGRLGAMRAPTPVDLKCWRHPDVGWGLLLLDPDNDAIDAKARATAEDAPEPLRRLVAARNAPVLRWSKTLKNGYLRRYGPDGSKVDLSITGGKRGVGPNALPRYLLIYGDPDTIPWRTQYALNGNFFVGRLPALGDEALGRYVDCLIDGWPDPAPSIAAPLLWTVDHRGGDITSLMRAVVGKALWDRFGTDTELTGKRWLDRADATTDQLITALHEQRPALVTTTSHGIAGPAEDLAGMGAQLGQLVDARYRSLAATDLLAGWNPGGAIWYAHACCSAGSEAPSRYAGLFATDDANAVMLRGVAALGPRVAPLPRALLSAPTPLKAWVGHVEPTFNWTLYNPGNNENLAGAISAALYAELYQTGAPIGWALREVFLESKAFYASYVEAIAAVNDGDNSYAPVAQYRQLVAMDREAMVLLGDPTVDLGLT